MFEPGWKDDGAAGGFLVGGANRYSIFDKVQVPSTTGEYVLSWRWDCEQTDQVWNSCADIVITDGPLPPTPAPTPPAPTPAPTPSPSGQCPGFKPDAASYACYYNGCKEHESSGKDCKVCCRLSFGKVWYKQGNLLHGGQGGCCLSYLVHPHKNAHFFSIGNVRT